MSEIEKLYDPFIGQKVGNGQCGALTSDYMRYMTDCKYQWAGEPGDGELPPHTDAINAWNVYTQTDWNTIGFEYINNPTADQVKAGDTFYIAPRPGLPTGHTGLVSSVANGNITTFEQNVLDAQYVQKLPGDNSWSWYGGFDGIVRKKAKPNPPNNNSGNNNNKPNNEGDLDMPLLLKTNTHYCPNHKKTHKEAWWVTNGVEYRHIGTQRELEFAKKCYPRAKQDLWEHQIEDAINGSGAIYRKK